MDRVERATVALAAYAAAAELTHEPQENVVIDLLSDLLHLIEADRESFIEEADDRGPVQWLTDTIGWARVNFEEERETA